MHFFAYFLGFTAKNHIKNMESGNPAAAPSAAQVCTCGDDLARNGGSIHNYSCQMTPKCQHMVSKRDPSGRTIQAPCGSRLDRHICHSFGCPCLPLCPHCGTSMDRRGVHNIGCPNRPNYSFEYPGNFRDNFLDGIQSLRRYHYEQLVIPVSSPSIIPGDFEIKGQCSICIDECEQSQRVLKPSECDHCFHENCLTPWIREHSTCPNCRREIETILRKN